MERRRNLLAALSLLLLVAAFIAHRRLSPPEAVRVRPVLFSADGSERLSSVLRRFAAMLGRGSSPVTVGEARKAVAAAAQDPLARRFADEFMADPALKKAWEKHSDDAEAKVLIQDVVEAPEFAPLLDRWQNNSEFLALAERVAEGMESRVTQPSASSDRMLLTAASAPPPAPPPAPTLRTLAPVRSPTQTSDLARFKSIFGMMEPEPRKRVLAQLEQGYPVGQACGRAGAARDCDAGLKRCRADEECARWLAKIESSGQSAGPGPVTSPLVAKETPAEEGAPSPDSPEASSPAGGGGRSSDGDESGDRPASSRPNPFAGLRPPKSSPKGGQKAPTTKPAPKTTETNCYTPKGCFAAGTRVMTPLGEVPIETIRSGDLVLSADARDGRLVTVAVLATFRGSARGLRRLTFADGRELRVTAEHPFFDPRAGAFRAASELRVGDEAALLPRRQGILPSPSALGRLRPFPAALPGSAAPLAALLEPLTVIGVEELGDEAFPIFNFHVGGDQNYFAEGVLVHNKPCAF